MILFFYSVLIDESRTGVLRFKTDLNGDFLDSNKTTSTPLHIGLPFKNYKMLKLFSKITTTTS